VPRVGRIGDNCDYGRQVSDKRVMTAACRVLDGDDSVQAANALEGLILDLNEDDRFDDLAAALALYSPLDGPPYTNAEQLRAAIREALPE
jgi:hypothetical protein